MSKKGFLASLLLLLSSFIVFSQTNFSGTWTFKSQETVSGNLYSNGSPKKISVVQKSDAVTIEKISDKGDGTEITSSETPGLDGKPFETTTSSKRKKVITVKWSDDKKKLTETASIYSLTDPAKMDYKVTDTYSLSGDGRELTLDRLDENFTNGETWESKAVYDKQ